MSENKKNYLYLVTMAVGTTQYYVVATSFDEAVDKLKKSLEVESLWNPSWGEVRGIKVVAESLLYPGMGLETLVL